MTFFAAAHRLLVAANKMGLPVDGFSLVLHPVTWADLMVDQVEAPRAVTRVGSAGFEVRLFGLPLLKDVNVPLGQMALRYEIREEI